MKILCYGDSNTYGYDPRSFLGDRYPAPWVDLLAQKLPCKTVNAGENGRAIPRRKGEFLLFRELLAARKPLDLLIVMLGTNDLLRGNTPEAVTGRMETFLNQIDLEKSRILLIAPPPMKLGQWVSTQQLIDASGALGSNYKTLAERLGIPFADAGQWNIPLAWDGVHFTEEGHVAFSERLYDFLNKGE